jgi:hypothetical protein
MLYREIMAAFCENRMEHTETPCGMNAECLLLNLAVHKQWSMKWVKLNPILKTEVYLYSEEAFAVVLPYLYYFFSPLHSSCYKKFTFRVRVGGGGVNGWYSHYISQAANSHSMWLKRKILNFKGVPHVILSNEKRIFIEITNTIKNTSRFQ